MYEGVRSFRKLASVLVVGLLIVAAMSCASRQSEDTTAATPPQAAPVPSDANIAAIVVAANNADIENGKQAVAKSQNAEVKAFGQQMITDHTAVNDRAVALATRLGLTPEDNETSIGIKTSQDSVRASLAMKSGAEFDKAYVDNEVSYHQTVLDAIDQVLIPNAQNAELKQILTETRPVIAAHLEHAKQIQGKLGGTASL